MSDNIYFEITFSGDYETILEFMNEKDMNYYSKRVSLNKIYLKASQEVFEELSFFKGSALNENFTKINEIKIINIEEYNNTEEFKDELKKISLKIQNFSVIVLSFSNSLHIEIHDENSVPIKEYIQEFSLEQLISNSNFFKVFDDIPNVIITLKEIFQNNKPEIQQKDTFINFKIIIPISTLGEIILIIPEKKINDKDMINNLYEIIKNKELKLKN